jgi:hypothetical protein
MTFALTTPVTGAAQTGFTTPAYVLTTDTAPMQNGKQFAVTSLTGTQAGVTTHSVASPFTGTFVKPSTNKVLGKPNPTTGLISSVPRNVYKFITRKGVLPLTGQPYATMLITTSVEVPAGADTVDAANVRAGLSFHIGALSQQSAGIGDTGATGIM